MLGKVTCNSAVYTLRTNMCSTCNFMVFNFAGADQFRKISTLDSNTHQLVPTELLTSCDKHKRVVGNRQREEFQKQPLQFTVAFN